MSPPSLPTISLIVHAWGQPGRLGRLLATVPAEVVHVCVSEGTWREAGTTDGGGPADKRLPTHAAAGPQVPAIDALATQAGVGRSDLAAVARAVHEAALPPGAKREIVGAEGTEAQSRLGALNRADSDWVVLLDPYDLPPRGWWESLVAFVVAHPSVGAISVPTVQTWWGGEVRDQHFTYRIVALRRNAVYGVPFGGEYDVRAPHATVHLAPVHRDVMGDVASAMRAAARAARGMQGDVHREMFEGAYGAAQEALDAAPRSVDTTHKVLDAGAAWMVLTGGPAPAFVWRDGTIVALRGPRR